MKTGLALLCVLGALAIVYAQDAPAGCDAPIWNAEVQENWPLQQPSTRKKTVFRMIIRGIGASSTFTPGKKYSVIVTALRPKRQPVRMHGFHLVADSIGGEGCEDANAGMFKVPKKGTGVAKEGCRDVIYDGATDLRKSKGIKWVAPSCGCVILSVTIKSSTNKIFYDTLDDSVDPKYKLLAKKICAE